MAVDDDEASISVANDRGLVISDIEQSEKEVKYVPAISYTDKQTKECQ